MAEKIPISTVFDIKERRPIDSAGVPISTVFEVEGHRPVIRRILPAVPVRPGPGWSTMALIMAVLLGYIAGKRGR